MIIVAGILKVASGDIATIREDAKTVVTATRREPGCAVYAFAEDLLEPGLIRIYEEWESREHLAAHGRSDHVAAWHAALKTVTVERRALEIIDAGAREALD